MVKGSRAFSTSGFVSRQGVTQALLKLRSDSQSVETATMISIDVGYDAGKQVHGRKRHLSVDMLGRRFAGEAAGTRSW